MQLRQALSIVLLIVLLTSCNSEVAVVIDNSIDSNSDTLNNEKKIVIDDKISITLKADSTTSIKLPKGNHTIQINNGSKQTFAVGSKGGLLNLGNTEYVIYEIEYSSAKKNNDLNIDFKKFQPSAFIIIDSFVVIQQNGKKSIPDSVLMKYVEAEKSPNEADRFHGTRALQKTGKGKLFIDRDWDYNMNDSIPETLEVRTSKYSIGNNSTTRSSIMPARLFLFIAMFNKEEYEVREISEIRKGTMDKEKIKELNKKKLEF